MFHVKKRVAGVWTKVADCKTTEELKNSLLELAKGYARPDIADGFLKPLGPVTPGNIVRADKIRVYDGSKWVGVAWLKSNRIVE